MLRTTARATSRAGRPQGKRHENEREKKKKAECRRLGARSRVAVFSLVPTGTTTAGYVRPGRKGEIPCSPPRILVQVGNLCGGIVPLRLGVAVLRECYRHRITRTRTYILHASAGDYGDGGRS
ncbi:hypothetical protein HDV57DRAFT_91337 [Trichoderma longibrachiatum]|uniref:Uncharacterized protein n=1 Tax=Trichoderma longibrachiatum ATCC 18648 TaxID=983965 RepID=A0A2T4BT59_TRILO|nr:hypothetical protein M440DRAFT_1090198 [Trichoderma longibrachiatum ATCC 18648]